MKTTRDAKRAAKLAEEREEIIALARKIAHQPADSGVRPETPISPTPMYRSERLTTMEVTHLLDDLRSLVMRETAAKVAVIDKQLRALGVQPEPFNPDADADDDEDDEADAA